MPLKGTSTKVPVVCVVCRLTFLVIPFEAARRRYCSVACMAVGQSVPKRPLAERFWEKVNKNGPVPTRYPEFGPCWIWTSGRDGYGYGKILDGRRQLKAHRLAYTWASGNEPDGFDVCHVCDTPACVRNDEVGSYSVDGVIILRFGHLFLGTERINLADMRAKGRSPDQTGRPGRQGEASNFATLTNDEVVAIRAAKAAGEASQHALARQYGVTQGAISNIIRAKSWKHLL